MGALAGRLGRHRSRIAGAAGLIAALAVAAPAVAQDAPALLSWEQFGGLAPTGPSEMKILKDRTIRATGDDPAAGTEARITPAEKAKVKRRLRRFGSLKRSYGPPDGVVVFDGITETVRAKGHTVSVTSGGDWPPRLTLLLNLLNRLHLKYLGQAPEPSR
jgi:hypothetical protein